MAAQDLESLRRVTANYACLQGLKLVPWSLPLLVSGLATASWWPVAYGGPTLAVLAVAYGLAWLASLRLGRFYERRFGVVRPSRAVRRAWAAWTLAVVAAMIVGVAVDLAVEPPVSVFGILFACGLLAYWSAISGLRLHHATLAALIVAAGSVRAVFGGIDENEAFGVLMAGIAVVYAISGLADHRYLMRTLGRGRTA